MKVLIITGGNIQSDFALPFLETLHPDYILGVDRGLQFCYEHQIRPDYIVGDFDSLPGEILTWFKENTQIPIREYNPVKDATDTMIALEKALEQNCTEIWILGATGTRLDHVFANIHILKNAWKAGVTAHLVDQNNRITLPAQKQFVLEKEKQHGRYVSFFSLEDEVQGLTLRGFRYPLDNYCLKNCTSLGVSNEITEEYAYVSWEEGILLMIQSKD